MTAGWLLESAHLVVNVVDLVSNAPGFLCVRAVFPLLLLGEREVAVIVDEPFFPEPLDERYSCGLSGPARQNGVGGRDALHFGL